jgi:hypothetical protein
VQLATAYRSRLLLVALSLASLALSFWLLFRAGCAGDLKGGALGDPKRALELEYAALPCFFLGVVAGITCIALVRQLPVRQRIGLVGGALLIGVPALWLLGIQFEVWGVQYCF